MELYYLSYKHLNDIIIDAKYKLKKRYELTIASLDCAIITQSLSLLVNWLHSLTQWLSDYKHYIGWQSDVYLQT